MSNRKKAALLSECSKCGCFVLTKDENRHRDDCDGDPGSDGDRVYVRPGVALHGTTQHIPEPVSDLPEHCFGWLKDHLVLVHPSTLRALDVQPRQPVCIDVTGERYTAVLWPSIQVSPLRCWMSTAKKEQRVFIQIVKEVHSPPEVQLSVDDVGGLAVAALQQFVQAYVRGSFLLSNFPFRISFCGRSLRFQPSGQIEEDLEGLAIEQRPPRVLEISSTCCVSIIEREKETPTSKVIPFDAIPGLTEAKRAIRQLVLLPLKSGSPPCSILLYGVAGSGKSLLMESLPPLIGPRSVVCRSIDELVEALPLVPPSSIVLADVNGLPKDVEHAVYSVLPEAAGRAVTIVLAVRAVEDVDLSIRVRFQLEVECAVPSDTERESIISFLDPSLSLPDVTSIASQTHAFTGSDLAGMLKMASCMEGNSSMEKIELCRRRVRPTGLRQFALEVPTVKWSDVAGNEDLKAEIEQAVIAPLRNKEDFLHFGIKPPSGILLYGPPGCSKTLIARALAHESKINFISVKGPELFSKWVGDSEKAIRQLFARARQVAPSIVFFDEIDAVGSARGGEGGGGVNERVLAQLLTELDGLESNEGVLLLAATNRPDHLDQALLRPGRLDRSLYVPLPNASTRRSLLALRSAKIPLADEVDLDSLVESTDGYSGAELVAVLETAANRAMMEKERTERKVFLSDLSHALEAVRPRTDRSMLAVYEKFKKGARE